MKNQNLKNQNSDYIKYIFRLLVKAKLSNEKPFNKRLPYKKPINDKHRHKCACPMRINNRV